MPLFEGRHACLVCNEYLGPGRNRGSRWKGPCDLEDEVLFQFMTAGVAVGSHFNEAYVKETLH